MRAIFGGLIFLISCGRPAASPPKASAPADNSPPAAQETADTAPPEPWSETALIRAMAADDWEAFVKALPPYPVRYSADGYLSKADPLWMPGQDTGTPLLFGYEAGTGDSIYFSPKQFFERFLARPWPEGERTPDSIPPACQGNTINNIAEFFGPHAHYVTYCLPGSEQYAGMDWAALRIIRRDDSLLAIVRDAWTP